LFSSCLFWIVCGWGGFHAYGDLFSGGGEGKKPGGAPAAGDPAPSRDSGDLPKAGGTAGREPSVAPGGEIAAHDLLPQQVSLRTVSLGPHPVKTVPAGTKEVTVPSDVRIEYRGPAGADDTADLRVSKWTRAEGWMSDTWLYREGELVGRQTPKGDDFTTGYRLLKVHPPAEEKVFEKGPPYKRWDPRIKQEVEEEGKIIERSRTVWRIEVESPEGERRILEFARP
jgi:hypothetical protein